MVNFLNRSVEELIEKGKEIKHRRKIVEFIKENLDKAKIKLDSGSPNLIPLKYKKN